MFLNDHMNWESITHTWEGNNYSSGECDIFLHEGASFER